MTILSRATYTNWVGTLSVSYRNDPLTGPTITSECFMILSLAIEHVHTQLYTGSLLEMSLPELKPSLHPTVLLFPKINVLPIMDLLLTLM